jgi:membrane protein
MRTIRIILAKTWESIRYYIWGVSKRFIEDDALFLSSGIAFNVLFCSIPVLLLASSLVGTVLFSSDALFRNVHEFILRVFPNQPHAESIQNFINHLLRDLVTYRKSMGLLGFGVLVYTATSLFSAVRSALHRVYRVTARTNLLITQIKDILLVLSIGILFILVNGVHVAYTLLIKNSQDIPGGLFLNEQSSLFPYLSEIAAFFLSLLMAFLAYRFIPSYGTSNHSSLIAASFTTIAWEVSSRVFALYLVTFKPFTQLYGAYAFILAGMFWIYYTSAVFIVGGEIGSLYVEYHKKKSLPS